MDDIKRFFVSVYYLGHCCGFDTLFAYDGRDVEMFLKASLKSFCKVNSIPFEHCSVYVSPVYSSDEVK